MEIVEEMGGGAEMTDNPTPIPQPATIRTLEMEWVEQHVHLDYTNWPQPLPLALRNVPVPQPCVEQISRLLEQIALYIERDSECLMSVVVDETKYSYGIRLLKTVAGEIRGKFTKRRTYPAPQTSAEDVAKLVETATDALPHDARFDGPLTANLRKKALEPWRNQMRTNISTSRSDQNAGTGAGYNPMEQYTVTGGMALRYYASLRMKLEYGGRIADETGTDQISGQQDKVRIGHEIKIINIKNKLHTPFLKSMASFLFPNPEQKGGWSREESERGWGVRPDGVAYYLTEEAAVAGTAARVKRMREHEAVIYKGRTPDEYSRPSGKPQFVSVSSQLLEEIKKSKDGVVYRDRQEKV